MGMSKKGGSRVEHSFDLDEMAFNVEGPANISGHIESTVGMMQENVMRLLSMPENLDKHLKNFHKLVLIKEKGIKHSWLGQLWGLDVEGDKVKEEKK